MKISLVAALAKNGVIGKAQKLPWHLPEELKYFRQLTLGKPIIMGRQTFASIGNHSLPNRHNIVLTRQKNFTAVDMTIVHTVLEAIKAAGESEEIMVIGGAEIYQAFLLRAERLYLSIIPQDYEGDTFFPSVVWADWQLVSEQEHLGFTAQIWDRK
jgi:dihydrofolate reductase